MLLVAFVGVLIVLLLAVFVFFILSLFVIEKTCYFTAQQRCQEGAAHAARYEIQQSRLKRKLLLVGKEIKQTNTETQTNSNRVYLRTVEKVHDENGQC